MILHEIGTSVCHQSDIRSFTFSGQVLPLCSRCTGIYLGAFITYAIFLISLRTRMKSGLPSTKIMYFLIGCVILMGLDVGSVLLKLRITNNYIRLATGFLTGSALVSVLYPISNYILWQESDKKEILENIIDVGRILFFLLIFYIMIISGQDFLFWLVAGFSISGILVLYLNINLLLLVIIFKKENKFKKFKDLIYFIPGVFLLAFLELYLLRIYHIWIRQ